MLDNIFDQGRFIFLIIFFILLLLLIFTRDTLYLKALGIFLIFPCVEAVWNAVLKEKK